MGRIPKAFIQDLIARSDIVEIIRTRVTLNKRGKNFLGCCPFHQEKTPSFTVSPDKQFYYCFGCGAHGNAISFLMQFDHMDFIESLHALAAQLGVEIPQENKKESNIDFSALYQLMEKCARFYEQQLKPSKAAVAYLKNRGLTGKTAKHFILGYAPAEWDQLTQFLTKETKPELLENLGLLIAKSPRYYDRFRNRIIFPIRDVRGRVIAFGGRTISDEQPKYLNSPETVLFHKSNELYGLYEARLAHTELPQALIVEGYMDVIGLAQNGINYAVATLGTAINSKHLQKILRYTNKIIFCFDGDNAGQQAAWKALTISLPILREGIYIHFIFLPKGEDPDSLVAKIGKEAFEKLIEKAPAITEVFFNKLKQEISIDTVGGRAHFAKQAQSYLNTMSSGIYQKLLNQQLAEIIQINEKELQLESPLPKTKPAPRKPQGISTEVLSPAQQACALLLKRPEIALQVEGHEVMQELKIKGMGLLIRLIEVFKKAPQFTVGQLLSEWEPEEDHPEIVRLASLPLIIKDEGVEEEFQGAFRRLKQQQLHEIAQKLIEKAKHAGLSDSEKEQLQAILVYKSDS